MAVWCPDWPRRVTTHQRWASSQEEALELISSSDEEGFVSTYAFPRGHSSDGEIPRINTLFFDLDIDGDYSGNGDVAAWRRDISQLLVRARKVAQFISDEGADGWRAALSGHKGIHLFLDFPALRANIGPLEQYKRGIEDYTNTLVEYLAAETGIRSLSEYVDVTSSDMGRLCRLPNTLHSGATAAFSEERFCVSVSIEELASMTVDRYQELTRQPRAVPYSSRSENENVAEIIEQHVVEATPSRSAGYAGSGDYDQSRIDAYRERSNDAIDVEDVPRLLMDRPTLLEWLSRSDKWAHRNKSHDAEIAYMTELVNKDVPIDVIKQSLAATDGYDADYTEEKIKQIIARDYDRWSRKKIRRRLSEFT